MPRNRGKRRRVAEGIYLDATGYEVVAKVGSGATARQKSKRFERGSRIDEMQAWRAVARQALATGRRRARGDTLADDIALYLTSVKSLPSYVSRTSDIRAWGSVFGDRQRRDLTLVELQGQIAVWHKDGYAPSTLSHRRDALVDLYRVLDEGDQANVALKLKTPDEGEPEPRDLGIAVAEEILSQLQPSLTKAWLMVMLTTGIPPQRLRMLKPGKHLDLDARTIFLTKRLKGKGTTSKTFRLTRAATEAFGLLLRHDADVRQARKVRGLRDSLKGGPGRNAPKISVPDDGLVQLSKESIYATFMRALARANVARAAQGRPPIPPCRAYDLRHTFLTEVYRRTRDLRAVAEIGDITLQMALRYTKGAVPEVIEQTIAKLDEAADLEEVPQV